MMNRWINWDFIIPSMLELQRSNRDSPFHRRQMKRAAREGHIFPRRTDRKGLRRPSAFCLSRQTPRHFLRWFLSQTKWSTWKNCILIILFKNYIMLFSGKKMLKLFDQIWSASAVIKIWTYQYFPCKTSTQLESSFLGYFIFWM